MTLSGVYGCACSGVWPGVSQGDDFPEWPSELEAARRRVAHAPDSPAVGSADASVGSARVLQRTFLGHMDSIPNLHDTVRIFTSRCANARVNGDWLRLSLPRVTVGARPCTIVEYYSIYLVLRGLRGWRW